MLQFKHLKTQGYQYCILLFNLSLRYTDIPSIKRQANLGYYIAHFVSMPGIKSIRISLTLTTHPPPWLAKSQHGFRQQRSTTSALLPLAHKTTTGFNKQNQPDHTGLISIWLSKTSDIVSPKKLLQANSNSSLNHNIVQEVWANLLGH